MQYITHPYSEQFSLLVAKWSIAVCWGSARAPPRSAGPPHDALQSQHQLRRMRRRLRQEPPTFGIELFYDFRKIIRRAAFDWISGFIKHDHLTRKHSDFDEESINIHRHPSKRATKTPSTCQRSKTTRNMMNSKPLDCTLSPIAIVVRS